MNLNEQVTGIVDGVGGKENVESLTHCVTRLRFKLKDESKVNKEILDKIPGVMTAVSSGGQYQVVIGNKVGEYYQAIMDAHLLDADQGIKEDAAPKGEKQKLTVKSAFSNALDILISSVTPTIPMIAGSGMIKVLCAILLSLHLMTDKSSTYQVLSIIGDGVYYFLPFFVAFNAAKRLKVDVMTAMTLAAIMMHPNLAKLVSDGAQYSSFASIPLRVVDYSAQVLPIILVVAVAKYVDKFADKVSPSLVKVFLRPMITLLITAPIALIAVGPLASFVGDYFTVFVNIMNQWGWIAVGLNAAIFPFLVLSGTHNALIPLMIQMFATQHFDAVLVPSGLVANISESGAAAAVAFKSKNKEMKGTALSAAISALFGITEPALFGVNLKLKRPFWAMITGALIGGCFAGLMGVTAYSFVSPSLVSLPIFISATSMSFVWAVVTVPVTFVVTFIITLLFGFDKEA